jgi:hypothetical protein
MYLQRLCNFVIGLRDCYRGLDVSVSFLCLLDMFCPWVVNSVIETKGGAYFVRRSMMLFTP